MLSILVTTPLLPLVLAASRLASINSTHKAVILDNKLTQAIRASIVVCCIASILSFCCLTLIFAEGAPPPPPPTHVQNYGPEGANKHFQFQYSQCTGKKKALCVCFNNFMYLNFDQSSTTNFFSRLESIILLRTPS